MLTLEEIKDTDKDNNLPDNILTLKHKDVNINFNGDIISISDLEKIFFLSKLNPDPAFIASTLKVDVIKVDRIIHSKNFQDSVNHYLSEYLNKNVGEGIAELTLRYSDLLKECFIAMRTGLGLRIRKAIEDEKFIDLKKDIPSIEKLMKLEFALHGLPVDLKGVVVGHKKSSEKTDSELAQSVKEIQTTLDSFKDKTFNPNKFVVHGSIQDADTDVEDAIEDAIEDEVVKEEENKEEENKEEENKEEENKEEENKEEEEDKITNEEKWKRDSENLKQRLRNKVFKN